MRTDITSTARAFKNYRVELANFILGTFKVNTQLLLAFSIIIVLLIGFGSLALSEVDAENGHVTHLGDKKAPRRTIQV
ncbi:hypothetical protein P3T18_003082 [Paraburkholderia sp. GAS199]|uniref:hypothetical protein n=1 Tax=Paraburkholderia sp. GAS199 TaxID=3035126 RepID=UPI003D1A3574